MLSVVISADVLRIPAAGVQRYTSELIHALIRQKQIKLALLCERQEHATPFLPDVEVRIHRPWDATASLGVFNRLLAYWALSPKGLEGFDILHLPSPLMPFSRRPVGPKLIMTVHDLIPQVLPEYHNWRNRVWFNHFLPRIVRMCDGFIADSHCTKQDMVRIWGVAPERIWVVHLGSRWEPLAQGVADESRGDYLLAVGTLEPRKNLRGVIQAFIAFKQRFPDRPEVLKIVGRMGWEKQDLHDLMAQHPQFIQPLGFVPDEGLPDLYRGAKALIYPSFYEGFGLPVLEAMALGCPVITSNRSSIPEVGGDAVIYANPDEPNDMAQAIARVTGDAALRADLTAKGLAQARKFSWDRCASETLGVYHRVTGK